MWLKPENRCLVPANSFAEYAPEPNPQTKKKDVVWFALDDDHVVQMPAKAPTQTALWNECLTTLSHTVEKLFFFARRVTLGSSIIRLIGTIVRCGLVVDRRPRWGVGKTRSGV
jgi:hypothetical protein